MRKFIGTKVINAKPMTRLEYNQFRGWDFPSNENGADAGYLVEYVDGGKPNTDQFAGYVSWSPAEQFENAYRETSGMSFGLAIEALKKGLKVARAGWNGRGIYVQLVQAKDFEHSEMCAHFAIKNVRNSFDTWVASASDSLADDWMMVE